MSKTIDISNPIRVTAPFEHFWMGKSLTKIQVISSRYLMIEYVTVVSILYDDTFSNEYYLLFT